MIRYQCARKGNEGNLLIYKFPTSIQKKKKKKNNGKVFGCWSLEVKHAKQISEHDVTCEQWDEVKQKCAKTLKNSGNQLGNFQIL